MLSLVRGSIGRLLILFLSIAMVGLSGCGSSSSSSSSSPEAAVVKLYEAIAANRLDEAAGYFSAKHLGATGYAAQMREHLSKVLVQAHALIEQQGGLDGVNVTQTKIDEPVALIEAEVKLKNGRTYRVGYSMTKEDSGWKAVLHNNNLNSLNLQ